jgi:aryl-alcohol dehydrogenase-like predicted oxidoreductase
MKHISLGGLDVSRIGLGAMTMAGIYTSGGGLDDAESIRAIHRALELGVSHIDTAEVYGPYHSEELVGRAIRSRRQRVVVATKFGVMSHTGRDPGVADSTPANIRIAVEGSLKRLGTDYIAPIPGTRRIARVEENTAADGVELSTEQVIRLNGLTPAAGGRHNEANMARIDR